MTIDKKEALKQLEKLKNDVKELEKVINTPEKDWRNVKSFEDACEFLGISADVEENKWKNAGLTESQIAGLKLEYCIKTINEGWKSNSKDSNQSKYYNWFEYSGGRWVFYISYASYPHKATSHYGSGFYYENKEKAEFGANNFKQYYDIWLG